MNKIKLLSSMKRYLSSPFSSASLGEIVVQNDKGEYYSGQFSTTSMTGGQHLWSKDLADAKRWGGEARDQFETPEEYRQYLKEEKDEALKTAKQVNGKVVSLR